MRHVLQEIKKSSRKPCPALIDYKFASLEALKEILLQKKLELGFRFEVESSIPNPFESDKSPAFYGRTGVKLQIAMYSQVKRHLERELAILVSPLSPVSVLFHSHLANCDSTDQTPSVGVIQIALIEDRLFLIESSPSLRPISNLINSLYQKSYSLDQ